MKQLRVLLLVHEDLVPPADLSGLSEDEVSLIKTEYDVAHGLEQLGHVVEPLGLGEELAPLRRRLAKFEPHVAFNLLEEFRGQVVYDHAVVSYLELLHLPYTGCNPRGLILARDKGLSKKILHYHRIRVPEFAVFPRGRRVRRHKRLRYPLIVKSLIDDASEGIAQASIVNSDDKLEERVRFIHANNASDAIAEQFIEGREVYVSILGNRRLQVLPLWELRMDRLPEDVAHIATHKIKFDLEYQKQHDIRIGPAEDLPPEVSQKLESVGKRIYRILGLEGYGRLDFRVGEDGRCWFLEANPNPDIAADEEMASAAEAAGIDYAKLLQKIVSLGLRRNSGR